MPQVTSLIRASLYTGLLLAAAAAVAGGTVSDESDGAATSAKALSDAIPPQVESAVVKVFSTMRYPDAFKPWTKQAPTEVTASGVVIDGKRILTNAHAVMYATQVQVQAHQAGDKISASVVAIAPGMDLAVLKLEDPSFFDSHLPVKRSSVLPEIKDAVLAYGYPTGGTSLSITKGIVSRIEFAVYNYPVSGLRIQVDAAINPGNSGGPAVVGDKMIGLAFSHLSNAQNIGYIIPNEEIDLFLADIADGHYDGKPGICDELQTLENPALRPYLKLDPSVHGIIVYRPCQPDAAYPLKKWDVITRIADTPVDDQGMVKVGGNLRVSFAYLVQKVAKQGRVPLSIVRGGKPMDIQLPVSTDRPMLIPGLRGSYPSYFIYGPVVFSNASAEFLSFYSNNATAVTGLSFIGSPLVTRRGDPPDAERSELVVVSSPFFPHRLSEDYSNPLGSVVYAINGTRVQSLKHLVTLLRDLRSEYVTIEFEQRIGETLVFRTAEVLAATEEILNDNGVRAQGSPDMMEIWRAKH
jgi:S1-C subfamily serine protease